MALRRDSSLPQDRQCSRDNLLAYTALREHDIYELQMALSEHGLSSLGRLEGHVLYTIRQVLARLDGPAPPHELYEPTPAEATELLASRTARLLGEPRSGRPTRIMVTLDPNMADNPGLFESLLEGGMDLVRINMAQGDEEGWKGLISAIRAAEDRLITEGKYRGERCRISMDLPGPKLRTGALPAWAEQPETAIRVGQGDRLLLYRDPEVIGHGPGEDHPPGIACAAPGALENVEVGHRVFFNDGKIHARVEESTPEALELKVIHPGDRTARLRGGKGLNFPDSSLELAALSAHDRAVLPFAIEHADAAALSFVYDADDITELGRLAREHGKPDFPLIAKVETRESVTNLARILLAGLHLPSFGVMIARGDLAVDVGFEQMARIQEDILCLCEAAHTPAIWATQVLDTMAKSGLPARAEITDAAMGQRAECVMLNKGRHLDEAVGILDTLLRAQARQRIKKREIFREFTPQDGVFPVTPP